MCYACHEVFLAAYSHWNADYRFLKLFRFGIRGQLDPTQPGEGIGRKCFPLELLVNRALASKKSMLTTRTTRMLKGKSVIRSVALLPLAAVSADEHQG